MENFSNDHEEHPNQRKNSHQLSDETGYLLFSLTEMETARRSAVNWEELIQN